MKEISSIPYPLVQVSIFSKVFEIKQKHSAVAGTDHEAISSHSTPLPPIHNPNQLSIRFIRQNVQLPLWTLHHLSSPNPAVQKQFFRSLHRFVLDHQTPKAASG